MAQQQAQTQNKTAATLSKVKLSYCSLHIAREGPNGGRATYSTQVLIPKDAPEGKQQLRALRLAARQARVNGRRDPDEQFRNPEIRDGDTDNPKQHTKGHWFITVRSVEFPTLLLRDGTKVTSPEVAREEFYSGVIVDMICTAFYYEKGVNKGVSWGLNIVRKRKDAPRLDGRPTIDDLPPLSLDDEDEDEFAPTKRVDPDDDLG